MKQFVLLLLLVAASAAHAQNYTDATDEKKIEALLIKVRQQQATEEDKKELQKMAVLIQNKGQDQQENQRQYKKSLATLDKAIVIFDALEDTLNVANNRKFKGSLLSRYGKFPEAKNEIKVAIDLYQRKNIHAGVAVSQFDLARIFEFQNKPDSAIYYADLACSYWKLKEVDMRVLLINNMLVSLFLKLNEPEKAKKVQQESALLFTKPGIHWQTIIDFYFTSMLLFRNMNDTGLAGDYQRLYLTKIAELQRTGINAKSYYENDR